MSLQFIVTGSFVIGNTTTNPIVLNELTLTGITTGSNLSGSLVSFLVSNDNTTYAPLYNDSSVEVTLNVTTAARSYALDSKNFFPWSFVKLRQGASASAIAQTTVNSFVDFSLKKLY